MRKELILILLLTTLNLNSQDDLVNSKWKAINQRIDSISYQNIKLREFNDRALSKLNLSHSKIDSLERELLYFKVKEDYYSTALSDQATRFTLIISGIIALFAIVSFGAFKHEVNQVKILTKKQIDDQNLVLEESKRKLESTENKLISTKANLYTNIAQSFQRSKVFKGAFRFYILASWDHRKSSTSFKVNDKEEVENTFPVTISNLKSAYNCLSQITKPKDIEWLKDYIDEIKNVLDKTYTLDSELVKDEISEIRVLLNKKLE